MCPENLTNLLGSLVITRFHAVDVYNKLQDIQPIWACLATSPWEFCVPVMENFIPSSMVWDAIATKHDY